MFGPLSLTLPLTAISLHGRPLLASLHPPVPIAGFMTRMEPESLLREQSLIAGPLMCEFVSQPQIRSGLQIEKRRVTKIDAEMSQKHRLSPSASTLLPPALVSRRILFAIFIMKFFCFFL